jgi:colanic acid biosynthesis protein WcaH
MLSKQNFKQLVELGPLISIDLVLLNQANQVLVGLRKNAPAKNFWFVPGGRVFKNELLAQAFDRSVIAS